jgi:hypothetical protein
LLFDRMSGLEERQLDELEERVAELLEEPWDKRTGRPREINFREAIVITCGYMRQNIIEDVWADIFDVDQSTISRIITFLTPLVEQATAEFRPAPEEAAEATRGAIALVDGTLWPCWSWDGERELWSGKYKTTGHGSLIVTNLQGRITFVSEPVTGNKHDMAKLKGSAAEEILKKAGGVFGDKGFIGTGYITTPIRKPECRELLQWEHEWKQSGKFLPRPSRARRRHLEDMADSLHRLPPAAEDVYVIVPRRNRALLLQGEFCMSLRVSDFGSPLGASTGNGGPLGPRMAPSRCDRPPDVMSFLYGFKGAPSAPRLERAGRVRGMAGELVRTTETGRDAPPGNPPHNAAAARLSAAAHGGGRRGTDPGQLSASTGRNPPR